jgi:hypothetical protein
VAQGLQRQVEPNPDELAECYGVEIPCRTHPLGRFPRTARRLRSPARAIGSRARAHVSRSWRHRTEPTFATCSRTRIFPVH